MSMNRAHLLRAAWILSVAAAVGVRAWNAIFGPLLYGYDHWAHVAYVFFIDIDGFKFEFSIFYRILKIGFNGIFCIGFNSFTSHATVCTVKINYLNFC